MITSWPRPGRQSGFMIHLHKCAKQIQIGNMTLSINHKTHGITSEFSLSDPLIFRLKEFPSFLIMDD